MRTLLQPWQILVAAMAGWITRQQEAAVEKMTARSPNLNAYAERFVRSIKEECLGRMIFFGEQSLRRATQEFAAHYHEERNHQGIGNCLIKPGPPVGDEQDTIRCSERLGGMLRFYHRAAA